MRQALAIFLGGLGMILGVVIASELREGGAGGDVALIVPPSVPVAATGVAPLATDAWVATILNRPVFDPSRAPAAAAIVATAGTLPRLAGTVITPDRKDAIFELAGAAVVAPEGGQVGPYTIREIGRENVVVDGPRGLVVLHTNFATGDTNTQVPAAAASPFSVVDGITGTPGGIWLDNGNADLPDASTWSGVQPLGSLPVPRSGVAPGPMLTPPGG